MGKGDSGGMLAAFMNREDANIASAMNKKKDKRKKKDAVWKKKVARYLAYCLDGGLMQSKFTLMQMMKIHDKLDADEQAIIESELAYMLHCHKRETPWEVLENLREGAKDINH